MTLQTERNVSRLSDPNTWLDRHGEALYRYALGKLGDPMLAEDAVQETLLAAIQARASYSGRSAERTWIMGILKHKIADQFRKIQREPPLDDEDEMVEDISEKLFDAHGHWKLGVSQWPMPERSFEQDQFWEVLGRCVDRLPPRLAKPFVLKEVEGLGSAEICQTLGISTRNNLWVMLSRARLGLRECMDKEWFARSTENKE